MSGEAWRDEDIELLKRLWSNGETAAAIAAKLHYFSRSAVLGKIFRLRLGDGGGGGGGKTLRAQAAAPPATATPLPLARRHRRAAPKPPVKPAPAVGFKTLFDLTNTCCRWLGN